MPLSTRLAFQFDKRVQIQGSNFYAGRTVKVTDSGPTFLFADVKDGKVFNVRLAFDGDKLLVSCGCRYYDDRGQCIHLWAAVLEADRRGALQDALKARFLEIADERLAVDDDDNEYEDRGIRVRPAPPPPIPAWQEYLGAIHRGLEQRKPPRANLLLDSETLFAIDVPSSKTAAAIVMELLTRSRKKSGEWAVPRELRISAAS